MAGKTYVLYHGGCWDGFCAAWVARRSLAQLDEQGESRGAFREEPEHFGEVEYVPVQYGQDPPAVERGARLYILDFSYNRGTMLLLAERAHILTVLDHHKTAQEALDGFANDCERRYGLSRPTVVFDMGKSGARLTWEHFHGALDEPSPGVVDYVEDRDLWRWALPKSREVNACLRSYPLDFDLWDDFGRLSAEELAERFAAPGEAILRRERQIVGEHVHHAREVELGGHRVPAVNATVLVSEIAGELAKGRPFGACYFDRGDGKRVWSLRSTEGGVDVSEVARSKGGGGHARAAGFEEAATR
jgi:oligoribonuclease NrnB/cAMP/cGMP phosphodiesterase (DHH superfamily)